MRRVDRNEDGIAALFVLGISVVMLGMAGYVIDVGIVRQEKRELQNGADAAALAMAQECALGLCSNLPAKAQPYADLNANDSASTVTGVTVSGATVKVDTRTRTTGGATSLTTKFAQLVGGAATSTVNATATATWGAPSGASTIPMVMSYCQWNFLTGNNTVYPTPNLTIYFKGDQSPSTCTGPSGLNMPGGFGWLQSPANNCTTVVTAGNQVASDPGNGNINNNGCNPGDFWDSGLGYKDLYIPIFSAFTGSGNNGTYTVLGLATFRNFRMKLMNGNGNNVWKTNPAPPNCAAAQRCLYGSFLKDIVPCPCGPLTGPPLGTLSVKLTA